MKNLFTFCLLSFVAGTVFAAGDDGIVFPNRRSSTRPPDCELAALENLATHSNSEEDWKLFDDKEFKELLFSPLVRNAAGQVWRRLVSLKQGQISEKGRALPDLPDWVSGERVTSEILRFLSGAVPEHKLASLNRVLKRMGRHLIYTLAQSGLEKERSGFVKVLTTFRGRSTPNSALNRLELMIEESRVVDKVIEDMQKIPITKLELEKGDASRDLLQHHGSASAWREFFKMADVVILRLADRGRSENLRSEDLGAFKQFRYLGSLIVSVLKLRFPDNELAWLEKAPNSMPPEWYLEGIRASLDPVPSQWTAFIQKTHAGKFTKPQLPELQVPASPLPVIKDLRRLRELTSPAHLPPEVVPYEPQPPSSNPPSPRDLQRNADRISYAYFQRLSTFRSSEFWGPLLVLLREASSAERPALHCEACSAIIPTLRRMQTNLGVIAVDFKVIDPELQEVRLAIRKQIADRHSDSTVPADTLDRLKLEELALENLHRTMPSQSALVEELGQALRHLATAMKTAPPSEQGILNPDLRSTFLQLISEIQNLDHHFNADQGAR